MKKEEPKKKSKTPFIIIGLVLVVAVIGGIYLSRSGPSAPAANNAARPNANAPAKTSSIPPNAPAGATPPNFTGSPTAQVTVEEFADYQCGSCATAHPVLNEIKSMYGSRIKFIFRNYPLSIPGHDKSYDAAVAAEAAGLQGKFWDMQNQLLTNQSSWTSNPTYKQIWNGYAAKIGLDIPRWENDIVGLSAKTRVNADMERAKAIGITGTPSIFINGQALAGIPRVDQLKAAIDAELQKVSAPAANPAPANANQ